MSCFLLLIHLLRETQQIHQPLTWRQLLLAALLLPFPSRHHLFKGNMGCLQGAFYTFSLPYLIWMDHTGTLKQVVRSEHVYLIVVYLWVRKMNQLTGVLGFVLIILLVGASRLVRWSDKPTGSDILMFSTHYPWVIVYSFTWRSFCVP